MAQAVRLSVLTLFVVGLPWLAVQDTAAWRRVGQLWREPTPESSELEAAFEQWGDSAVKREEHGAGATAVDAAGEFRLSSPQPPPSPRAAQGRHGAADAASLRRRLAALGAVRLAVEELPTPGRFVARAEVGLPAAPAYAKPFQGAGSSSAAALEELLEQIQRWRSDIARMELLRQQR